MKQRLHIYADEALGAYGYHEKEWYQPGARLSAFLAEIERRGLTQDIDFASAAPATKQDLMLFHSAEHIDAVRERCALHQGSLDHAATPVIQDAQRLLKAIKERSSCKGKAAADEVRQLVAPALVPAITFDTYLDYLQKESLLSFDPESMTLALTPSGEAFLASDKPYLAGPTLARAHIEQAARYVVGAVLDATRRILDGTFSTAFVPIAGFHHAHAEEARLYCLYNDPVLALRYAATQLAGNLAYVDIDIHQGDGVYEAFAHDPQIHIVDLHEDPSTLFPFTPEAPGAGDFDGRREHNGRGDAVGTKCNIPLAPDTTDEQYLALWEEAEAFLRTAKPQFIVFESGVDGLAGDPFSHQRLSTKTIYEVTRRVRALADEYAGGRLLVLGGGGYTLANVADGWAAVVEALLA